LPRISLSTRPDSSWRYINHVLTYLLTLVCDVSIYLYRDGSEYRWLRESHFKQDLQQDNIDHDVVREELQDLRADHTALT